MALHALNLLTHSRLISDIQLHQSHAKLVVLPPPCPHSIAPIDFGHASELIERSAQDARAFLDRAAGRPPPIRLPMPRDVRQG